MKIVTPGWGMNVTKFYVGIGKGGGLKSGKMFTRII